VRDLKGQTAVIYSLDLSDDGALLASASRDGTTRLWDVSGQFLATVAVRRSGTTWARFFPDGRRLALGYEDGEVEVRDLDHFFRYAAGQTAYQLRLFGNVGESFPQADQVLAWGRTILANRW
jgi:WD40 repeat protein